MQLAYAVILTTAFVHAKLVCLVSLKSNAANRMPYHGKLVLMMQQ